MRSDAANDAKSELVLDEHGHLRDSDAWNNAVAQQLAHAAGIDLTARHWQVIEALRRFYTTYTYAPGMRPMISYLRRELGPEYGSSVYLLTLFPGSPARVGARLAGLPKPANCL